jgi:hypothetical protein
MSRRGWLIALAIIEAVFWLSIEVMPVQRMFWITLGGSAFPLPRLLEALAFVGAVIIGALCRSWQGAIAVMWLASTPTLAFTILQEPTSPVNSFYLLAFLAALGLFGWLLRFVRAEFAT